MKRHFQDQIPNFEFSKDPQANQGRLAYYTSTDTFYATPNGVVNEGDLHLRFNLSGSGVAWHCDHLTGLECRGRIQKKPTGADAYVNCVAGDAVRIHD